MPDPRAAIRANLARIAALCADTAVLVNTLPDQPDTPPAIPPVVTPPTTGATASARHSWGEPTWLDKFDGPRLDPAKWSLPGAGGWPGHSGNGRRMPGNVFVRDGSMVLRGDANGNTGWVRQQVKTRYGRWEYRLSSRNTGSAGALLHCLAIVWPTSEQWPRDGELDVLETTDPNARKASAWLHYPHPNMPVQQEGPFDKACDMTVPHWFSVEWTSAGIKAWIDGEPWYSAAGGAGPGGRRNIQDMPEGAFGFQLDNFTGSSGLRPAEMVIDEVRFWKI
jgi:hypothetical protein